jgi:4-hydroxy-tetrahydrodipicolinate synthase
MRAVANGGLPLDRFMVGTGAAAMDDAVRLTVEAKNLGFAGALLLPPFYYKGIDEGGLVAYVDMLVRRVGPGGLNLYLYHFPVNSGVPYSADVVARLRDMLPGTLVGLKDSSGDLDYSAGLVRRLPGFDVFPSAEASLGRAAELGFAGCISATANVIGRFAQACWSGEGNAESQALASAVEIRAAIARFPLVAAVKATLGLLTGDSGWNRVMPPLNSLSSSQVEALRESLRSTELFASAAA